MSPILNTSRSRCYAVQRGVEKMLHLLGLGNFHVHACMSRLLDTILEKNKRAFCSTHLGRIAQIITPSEKIGTLGNSNQLASSGKTEKMFRTSKVSSEMSEPQKL